MQNSPTPPSTSASSKPEAVAYDDAAYVSASASAAASNGSAPPRPAVNPQIRQIADTARAYTAPTPAPSLRETLKARPRSLALLWRFGRVVVYFGLLFTQLLFWHWLIAKYAPGYVDRTSLKRWQRYARSFRGFALGLGGVMIKAGQFISTRSDILPPEVTDELVTLRDEVPSVNPAQVRAIIERELGSIPARFASFDEQPIAAASIGQVHRARLHSGDRVVVKVLRPNIRAICYTDLAAMFVVARVAMRFRFISKRMDAVALIDEFGRVLLEEVSYRKEAENARRFNQMFAHDLGVYVPAVYEDHSTDSVIVMEDVTTVKLDDYAALAAHGISRKAVAKRLMDTYLKQIFTDRFFHADPHPGNLFIYPLPEGTDAYAAHRDEGKPFYLIFIDFGMTATLTPAIVDGLIGTLSSVVNRDAAGLIDSYSKLGFLLPGADTERLEAATRAVFDQVWGLSMDEMRTMSTDAVASIGSEFNDLLFAMPFQVPQDFIYLGRTVSILSGLCTSLDPDFNPWSEMIPYTQSLIAERYGAAAGTAIGLFGSPILDGLLRGDGARTLFSLGQSIFGGARAANGSADLVQRLERGDIKLRFEPTANLSKQLTRIEAQGKRTTRAILLSGGVVSGAIFYVNGDGVPALIAFAFALYSAVSLLLTTDYPTL